MGLPNPQPAVPVDAIVNEAGSVAWLRFLREYQPELDERMGNILHLIWLVAFREGVVWQGNVHATNIDQLLPPHH